MPRTDIGSHDDDGVPEINRISESIGQLPVLEHLQQNIEEVGMRFLNLVQQYNRIRGPAHALGQLAAFFVADVTRGCAY